MSAVEEYTYAYEYEADEQLREARSWEYETGAIERKKLVGYREYAALRGNRYRVELAATRAGEALQNAAEELSKSQASGNDDLARRRLAELLTWNAVAKQLGGRLPGS